MKIEKNRITFANGKEVIIKGNDPWDIYELVSLGITQMNGLLNHHNTRELIEDKDMGFELIRMRFTEAAAGGSEIMIMNTAGDNGMILLDGKEMETGRELDLARSFLESVRSNISGILEGFKAHPSEYIEIKSGLRGELNGLEETIDSYEAGCLRWQLRGNS